MVEKSKIVNCMKCGDCLSVCPTFAVTGDESSSARGRIRLIKAIEEGELELSDSFERRIGSCMMCLACSANCPSGVKVDELIINARKNLAEKRGLPFAKRIAIEALKRPPLIMLAARIARLFGPFFGGVLPKVPRRFFSGRDAPRPEKPTSKVAFFAGCMVNYNYPEIGDAALFVLAKNGAEVLLKKEVCCGAPALYLGDEKTARELAERNVERFSGLGVDAIVTCCPTCANGIREYPRLLENDERAIEVADKICDISEFLVKSGFESGEIKEAVAYHAPCHLKYGAGTKDDLRIISSLQKNLKELEGCCGFAGTFSMSYPDLSQKISEKKIEEVQKAGADIVATGCPGCRMFIEKGLKKRGLKNRVMHTVELLNEAYK